jgi:hypothetical protein
LAALVRQALTGPHSEQVIRDQMLAVALQNLHQPGLLGTLVEVLPEVADGATRRDLTGALCQLDGSRFADLHAFYSALIAVFEREDERATRAVVLRRLAAGLHEDARLPPLFVSLLARPGPSDDEEAAVMGAIASLPVVSAEVAGQALRQARHSPTAVQALALSIAEACPHWDDGLLVDVGYYLEPQVAMGLRLRVLRRLAEARRLTLDYLPVLGAVLQSEPQSSARAAALELLVCLQGWDAQATVLLARVAAHDADPAVRGRAVELQAEAPDLSDEQAEALAARIDGDDIASVRLEVLALLQGRCAIPAVRAALATSFSRAPGAFDEEELTAVLEGLAPYAGRDPGLRDLLLGSAPQLRVAGQRRQLLDAVLAYVRPGDALATLAGIFRTEHLAEIRQVLFERLRPLSVQAHPELVEAFCAEVADPTSAFRLVCASALTVAIDHFAGIVATFEDVLRYDTDRELLRTCVEAYLGAGVARRADVLLGVAGNQLVDLGARQRCVDALRVGGMTAVQAAQLAEIVSSPVGAGLRGGDGGG